jgi:hypothetical protein
VGGGSLGGRGLPRIPYRFTAPPALGPGGGGGRVGWGVGVVRVVVESWIVVAKHLAPRPPGGGCGGCSAEIFRCGDTLARRSSGSYAPVPPCGFVLGVVSGVGFGWVCVGWCCGEVVKGARWMPWHQEPMKDVGGRDRPRGAVNRAVIRGCPNGVTRPSLWVVART